MTRPNARSWFLAMILIPLVPRGEAADYCRPVSSEEVVAGTADQAVTLDTAECTARFRLFLGETVDAVRGSYQPFFELLGADPNTIDALARLIAREQLLSTEWISLRTSISHRRSTFDAKLLQETDALLRGLLTNKELISLQNYKASLPTRELLRPVISRLQALGIPLSREQIERAVADVHFWAAGLMDRAHEEGGDELVSCEEVGAFMSSAEAQLLAIVSKSLDEQQTSAARAYYRERAEQRDREFAAHREKIGKIGCPIREF